MLRRILIWIVLGVPLGLMAVVGTVTLLSYVEHRRLMEQEIADFPPPGRLVPVSTDDVAETGRLHVYAEGAGQPTVVLLSGLGTSAPYFDFLPLLRRISPGFRTIVVERAGYGWSDISDRPRDIDTVLAETRAALAAAGEQGPFVLMPHSMAVLEAIRWAQLHPEEVVAIVGLDPLVPGYVEANGDGARLSPLITALARTGLIRDGPDVFSQNFPAMIHGRLDPDEATAAESVFFRRTNTPDMWAEVRVLSANAKRVAEAGLPDVPVHAFVSGEETEAWRHAVRNYAQDTGGTVTVLDTGHYVHVEKPNRIAREIREIIAQAGE